MGLKNKTINFNFLDKIVKLLHSLPNQCFNDELSIFLDGGGGSRTVVTWHGIQAHYQLSYLDCYSDSVIFRRIAIRIRLQMSLFQPFSEKHL